MVNALFINLYFIVDKMMMEVYPVIVELMPQKYNRLCLNQTWEHKKTNKIAPSWAVNFSIFGKSWLAYKGSFPFEEGRWRHHISDRSLSCRNRTTDCKVAFPNEFEIWCHDMFKDEKHLVQGSEKDKLIRSKSFVVQLSGTYIACFKQQSPREPWEQLTLESGSGLQAGVPAALLRHAWRPSVKDFLRNLNQREW